MTLGGTPAPVSHAGRADGCLVWRGSAAESRRQFNDKANDSARLATVIPTPIEEAARPLGRRFCLEGARVRPRAATGGTAWRLPPRSASRTLTLTRTGPGEHAGGAEGGTLRCELVLQPDFVIFGVSAGCGAATAR